MDTLKQIYYDYLVEIWALIILLVYFGLYYILDSFGVLFDIYKEFRPEILSIAFTVIIVDRIIRYRESQVILGDTFESDIHNYSRFLESIGSKVNLLIEAMKEENSNLIEFMRADILTSLSDEPIRRSFSNKKILKEKGERIDDSCGFARINLESLEVYLDRKDEDIRDLQILKGELFCAQISILELRAPNKRIAERGETFLERHRRLQGS